MNEHQIVVVLWDVVAGLLGTVFTITLVMINIKMNAFMKVQDRQEKLIAENAKDISANAKDISGVSAKAVILKQAYNSAHPEGKINGW